MTARENASKSADMRRPEFAILGAGAIGSILGAHLRRAGHSVAMIARGERAHYIERNGLQIRGLAEISVPARVVREPSELSGAEVLVVAMKTPGTARALDRLRELPFSTAFSIQNGLFKNELLTGCFGRERALGALADTSGELLGSGEVLFTRNTSIMLGELSGEISSRARKVAGIVDRSGVNAVATHNIRGLEWSKFCVWAGMMALSVITRATTWRYLLDPASALIVARVVREIGAVATALGIELTDESVLPVAKMCSESESQSVDAVIAAGARFQRNAPGHRMSALQDLEARRPLEIEETLGFVLREAKRLGRLVPALELLYGAVSAIDRLNRSPADG